MASVLQQLDTNQAVLLMYLADELPAAERGEVDRMLAVDAGLRAELDRLRDAYEWFSAEVARDDGATRPAVPQTAAVRRVGRAMRQWHAARLAAAPAPAPSGAGLRYPWWAYPLAAAASIVIAFLVWWGNTDSTPVAQRQQVAIQTEETVPFDPLVAESYRAELLMRTLGADYGYGAEPYVGAGGPPEWDDSGLLYAAVAPSDRNVLMLLNNEGGSDGDADPGADNESTTLQ